MRLSERIAAAQQRPVGEHARHGGTHRAGKGPGEQVPLAGAPATVADTADPAGAARPAMVVEAATSASIADAAVVAEATEAAVAAQAAEAAVIAEAAEPGAAARAERPGRSGRRSAGPGRPRGTRGARGGRPGDTRPAPGAPDERATAAEWVTITPRPVRLADALAAAAEPGPAVPPATGGVPGARLRYVDPLAGIKRKVHQSLLDALGPTLYDAELDEAELAATVRQTLQQVIESEQTLISTAERMRIANEVSDEILGYGPLEPFLRDRTVTEIMVNGADQIYVEREGRLHPVRAAFTDDNHLRRTIEKIVARVGRRIDESSPMVDARLTDGSRVNAMLPPVALDGPMLTIRKFSADPLGIEDLVGFGTLTPATANLLAACVWGRLNILISGGTGSGKTTTLNVMSSFIPADERIVTIEDAAELQLHQDHVVRMESRPSNVEGRGEITARDLVRNALRMRPDRIVVGEVRDGAALDMLQAMNTGHDGSLTTLHANSPRDALSRLETMVLMGGVELPTRAIREQAASAIDLIVHQARLRDGTRRITHITEVTGMESDVITLQDIFVFDYAAGVGTDGRYQGSLRPTGVRPAFLQRLADEGITLPADILAEQS